MTTFSCREQLNDGSLIEWLKANWESIPFIANSLHGQWDELEKGIRALAPTKPLGGQRDEVMALWRSLVGRAIVFLKSKDERETHHDDKDYGVERLDQFFRAFEHFEPVLWGAHERYRDHLTHMLTVFLSGEKLIRSRLGFDCIKCSDDVLPPENRITADEKEAMWCLMALTHDLGIAMERVADINPKVGDMLRSFGVLDMQNISFPFRRLPVDDLVLQLMSSSITQHGHEAQQYLPHVQSKYFLKFAEAYERRDHGIVSCLVLAKNLVFFLETDYSQDYNKPLDAKDAKQFLIRQNILRAIASHSNLNIYYLTVPQFPFLLTLFDDMHEWERPRFASMLDSRQPKMEVFLERLTSTVIHYQVRFSVDTAASTTDAERKDYRDQVDKYFHDRVDKYYRILRSAVGTRSLELVFEVEDCLQPVARRGRITHTNPENVNIVELSDVTSGQQG